MRYTFNMPSRKETLTVVGITALFLLLTAVCLGLRPEHLADGVYLSGSVLCRYTHP